MYFQFCTQRADDLTIEVPEPWLLESLPKGLMIDLKGLVFKETAEQQAKSVHATRELTVNVVLVDPKSYDSVRQFYQKVRAEDEAQAVLSYGRPAR